MGKSIISKRFFQGNAQKHFQTSCQKIEQISEGVSKKKLKRKSQKVTERNLQLISQLIRIGGATI